VGDLFEMGRRKGVEGFDGYFISIIHLSVTKEEFFNPNLTFLQEETSLVLSSTSFVVVFCLRLSIPVWSHSTSTNEVHSGSSSFIHLPSFALSVMRR